MADPNWQKVREVFDAALQQEPAARQNYINEACCHDEVLLTEVESLFSSLDKSDEFLETPAVAHVADLIDSPTKQLAPGTRFGHYEVTRQIGIGGTGEVYLAKDLKLDRRVAVKILNKRFNRGESNLERFEREAKAASALNHPNILVIHEIGESETAHYIVSEFIEGRTLREVLNQSAMSLEEVVDVATQIASALSAAHEAHLVHRDIKPENVMVRPDGYVKVLDFGLAKLVEKKNKSFLEMDATPRNQTAQGMILGTVNYMSPEQAKGEPVDEQTDIFSFGVVLYEMMAGESPFAAHSMAETLANLINAEPQPFSSLNGSVPDELKRIGDKTLRKNKDQRYQTMKDVLFDLKGLEVEVRSNRSLPLNANGRRATNDGGLSAVETAGESAARIGQVAQPRAASSGKNLVNEIRRNKRRALFVGAAILVAVAAIAYFYYPTASGEAIDSIAVLPFINVSADANTEYLSEGISDSIIHSLSRLPNLKVRPFTSVVRYKGAQVDPQAVGRELNVRAVLTGRLTRQADGGLTISAALVDVRDNRQLWGEQYSRQLSDVLVVQAEIARQISDGLRLRLNGEEKKQLAKQYTENNDAFLLYSLGKFFHRQNTKEGFERAIESFEDAIKIDPKYALAYAGLAGTYHFMGTRGFSTAEESERKVEQAALKALQLDDTLAEGHTLLGINKYNDFDWAGAEKELKRGLELDPNSSLAHLAYFGYWMAQGRSHEGLQSAIRAQELDPTNQGFMAFAYFLARKHDKAIESYQKALEKNPDNAHVHILLGEAYVAKGMFAEGVAEMQKGVALDATLAKTPERWDRYPLLAYAYSAAGQRNEALKILDEQHRLAKQRYVSPYNFAIIYTGLGDKDQAFAWLVRCVTQRTRPFWQFRSRPLFDPLRSDPRYAELLRRMNLEG